MQRKPIEVVLLAAAILLIVAFMGTFAYGTTYVVATYHTEILIYAFLVSGIAGLGLLFGIVWLLTTEDGEQYVRRLLKYMAILFGIAVFCFILLWLIDYASRGGN